MGIRKAGTSFVIAALILCMSLISCQTLQKEQQSMDVSEAKQTMEGLVQRMEALQTEVAQMHEVMTNNPEAVLGDKEGIVLSKEQMLQMCQNMNQLVETINEMMMEIGQLVSNEELMMNEALKDRATRLVDKIHSCVNYCEGIWSGQQN